jgi:DNA-binding MarR family transcriptional regulator
MTDGPDDIALPVLLRAARQTYRSAVRKALTDAGFDDVPRDGPYVMGVIARTGMPLGQIIKGLGVSKQAAGQLVDTLVMRGYLDRTVNTEDRRRLTVTLTERGQAATAVSRSAVDHIDAVLSMIVDPEYIAHTRATLMALAQAGSTANEA